MIRSPANFAKVLDGIAAGLTREQAVATLGGRASILYSWLKKSVAAEEAGDADSIFYFAWPSDSTANYLHHLVRRATERHWQFHQSFLLHSQFAVKDGKPAYELDDFGGVLFDDFGMPVVEQLVVPELPKQRPWKARREGKLGPVHSLGRPRVSPDGKLAPSSMGITEPPVVVNPPSAISEYIASANPKRPLTPLEEDLRQRLAMGPTNPTPDAPVAIIRDAPDDAKQERINRPSDQTGLPTTMADRPARQPPQQKPIIDYSRGNRTRIDTAGVGPGPDPHTLGGSRGFKRA